MRIKPTQLTLLFILLYTGIFCQTSLNKKSNGKKEISISTISKYLKETRKAKIHLPPEYFTDIGKSFPVLYLLDGQDNYDHTLDIINFLSSKGHIPNLIIVAIPHTGKRGSDYYTYHRSTNKLNEGVVKFDNYLNKELIPYVESNFRTTDYRILTGHSRSGLFVIHVFIHNPGSFNAFFAFSPSFHHTPEVINLLKTALNKNTYSEKYFYGNVGGAEFYKIREAFTHAKEIMEQNSPKGLRHTLEIHDIDGHQTTPFIGLFRALKEVYNPINLTLDDYANRSFNDLITHFEKASSEFGSKIIPEESDLMSKARYFFYFETKEHNLEVAKTIYELTAHYYPDSQASNYVDFIKKWQKNGTNEDITYTHSEIIEERALNSFGYYLLKKRRTKEAIYILKLNTKNFPESSNTYDSLGDAYEKDEDLKQALLMYKKAHQISQDLELKNYYSENIERILSKLGK